MITPRFRLEQDDTYLYIFIDAPYSKLNEVEVHVDNMDFRFYCKPYYLRLNLPGKIIDSTEEEKGVYDYNKNLFNFKFSKVNHGEYFEGLDLVTKLLTNPNKCERRPKIEEINNDDVEVEEDSGDEWFIEQNISESIDNINMNNKFKYGFALTKSNVFSKLSSEYSLIVDLENPDETSYAERRKLRIQNEEEKFDEDHYLADIYDNELIKETVLKYEPFWYSDDKQFLAEKLEFSQEELDCLKSLPKRTYLFDKKEKFLAYSGLIDILFSYCYNNRINCGEDNVESGWTITKLSSTLCWFDTYKSLEDVIKTSFRRCLCFPLYRNWELNKLILKDLIKLLKTGKKLILKCFLDIRKIFNKGDCRYLLNDLFINDYCTWIQYAKEKTLNALTESLEEIEISKSLVDLDLECIELAAELVLNEEGEEAHSFEDETRNIQTNTGSIDKTGDREDSCSEDGSEINENEISERLSKFLNIGEQKADNKPKIVELD